MFALFLTALLSVISPAKKLSNVHAINQQALAASERIYEILEEQPVVQEQVDARQIKDFRDNIVFRDIWFKYEDDFVLQGINLEVKRGEVVALVGHSGAGKSTLVSLLPRLYDPQKGSICIDGIDLRAVKLKDLRAIISVVSQEMVLFNATIRDNIAYGKKDATEAEIIDAAKKAYAFDFIMNLPQKFDAVIGDRGLKLSGGEKQRLSIARAILKNAPVLILDEATSHLDSVSESLVKEALALLMKERTVFVIAHRFSTVQRADKVVVMEKGRIIDIGTHDSLVSSDSVYKRLYELQFNV